MSEQLLQFSFDSTLGAVFIGYIFALVLYGVTCLQTIIYFHKCAKDSLLLKSLIATLWLLDNLHTILISHGTYLLLVSYHANPFEAIAAPPWSYSAQVYVTVISNLLVRTVFANRIYRLSHGNIIIPILVVVLSIYVLASGIVFGTESLRSKSWSELRSFSWSMYSGYAAEMLADSVIALYMSLMLVRMRTGLRSSDSLVQTFVMYSINTGLMTTICVFLSLITFITMPNTLAFLACYFVLSKLYVNSLLGTLNARTKMPSSSPHARAKLAKLIIPCSPQSPYGPHPPCTCPSPICPCASGSANTDSTANAYTNRHGESSNAAALLTTAIVLGSTEPGMNSLSVEEGDKEKGGTCGTPESVCLRQPEDV